jgi:hypothetical protein
MSVGRLLLGEGKMRLYLALVASSFFFIPTAKSMVMCPDGTYVGGSSCWMAPNGHYVGCSGALRMAPDGTYVCDTPAPISEPRELDGVGNGFSKGFANGVNSGIGLGNLWRSRRERELQKNIDALDQIWSG